MGIGTTTPAEAEPEPESVPTPTLPSSDTHYVLSAVASKTRKKDKSGKVTYTENREDELGGYKTETEYNLGYPFTSKDNEQRPAILKYDYQKKIAVGYYQGTSKSGKPTFNTIFELDPKAAGVKVFTNAEGKVTGVHVPKELAGQLNILKSEASKTDTNWKITNDRKGKLSARTVDESVTSDEKTEEVINAVTNSTLKKLLKKLEAGNLVSVSSIRALINTANVKGKDGQKVNAATVVDPKELATYLTRAIESYKWVSQGTKTIVRPDGGRETVDESGARRYAALVGEKIEGKGVEKEYVEQITREAKSLTSSKKADQDTRNSAISRMLTAAHEKAEADKSFTQYDEGAGNQSNSKWGKGVNEERTRTDTSELLEEIGETDTVTQQDQKAAARKEQELQEGGEQQSDTGTRAADERVDDSFVSDTANNLEQMATTSEAARRALRRLDEINVNPETMTEEDKAEAMEFAKQVHKDAETFYRNLYAIKNTLAGNLKVRTKVPATTIPKLPAAKGKKAIRDLIVNPDNGMTEEERKLNLALVDRLAPETLALLTFQITGSLDLDGNDNVQYEGTFNAITNIAKMMYGNKVDPSVMAEEIAHFTAKLLPERYAKKAREIHAAAFKRLKEQVDSQLKKATDKDEVAMLNAARDVIIEAKKRGGGLSSHDANRLIQAAAVKHGITMNAVPVREESLYGDSIAGGVAAYKAGPVPSQIGQTDKSVFVQNSLIDSPNFATWFGNSVMVVDGKPQVLFHGSTFEGSIDNFNEIAGFEKRLRKELGLTEDQDLPTDYEGVPYNQIDIDNGMRIGHFFAPNPAFPPYMFGSPPEGTQMYDELQRRLQYGNPGSTVAGMGNWDLIKNAFQIDQNMYPVFIRAENVFDGSNADHLSVLFKATKEAVADAKYLLGEVDPNRAWSDDAKVIDVLNYQREPDVKQLEEDGWTEVEITNVVEVHNEESAKIKAALGRLRNGFAVEKVKHLNQIIAQERSAAQEAIYHAEDQGLKEDEVNNVFRNWDSSWPTIEQYTRFIKYAGFDSYFVVEHGVKNIAVFDANQIKSSVANNGEFSLDPSSAISGSLSDTEAKNLNKLIELVYPVINPDEFYARGLVKYNTQSVYRKGLEIALDILGAILNNPAIKVDSVRERAERRKFFKEVSRMLKTGKGLDFNRAARPGGLLLKDAINTGHIRFLKSAATLRKALELQKAGGKAGDRAALLNQSVAAINEVDRILKKHMPADLSDEVLKKLQVKLVRDIGEVAAENKIPIRDYKTQYDAHIAAGRPEVAAALAESTLQFYKALQYQLEWIIWRTEAKAHALNSDAFKAKLAAAEKKFDAAVLHSNVEVRASKDLQLAINAIASLETNPRTLGVMAQLSIEMDGELAQDNLEKLKRDSGNLKGKAVQIASTVTRSATGSDLLTVNTNATAADLIKLTDAILEQYRLNRQLDPNAPALPAEGTELYKQWRMAAGLVASNHSLKENALALVFSERIGTEGIGKLAQELITGVENKKAEVKNKAIAKAVKRVTDYTKKAEQKRLIFQRQYDVINNEIVDLQTDYEASKVAEKFLNDLEIDNYIKLLSKHTGAIETPTFREVNKERKTTKPTDAVMPDNYANNVLTIPIPGLRGKEGRLVKVKILSGKEGKDDLRLMQEAHAAITEWLHTNEPDALYYEYYKSWLFALDNIFLSEMVQHPRQNVRTFFQKTYWSVLDQMLLNLPLRSSEVVKQLVRKHNLYFNRMGTWVSKYEDKWKNLALAAARSHGLESSLSGESTQKVLSEWDRIIGNELRASHQEGGRNLSEGDFVGSSLMITKADMAFLNFEGAITTEAYDYNKNLADIDSSTHPDYIISRDGNKKAIVRMPLKKGKTFLPRVFSEQGRELAIAWRDLNKNEGFTPADFDALFGSRPEAIYAFLVDRNPLFTKLSPLEEHYNIVADEVAQSSSPLSTNAIIEKIGERVDMELGDIKRLILEEYKVNLNSIERAILPNKDGDPTLIGYNSYAAEGPFAKTRGAEIAPYFFYQYGFRSQSDLKRFSILGSGRALENVISGIRSMLDEVDGLIIKVRNRSNELTQEGGKFAGRRPTDREVERYVEKEMKLDVKSGDAYHPTTIESLKYWRGALEDYAQTYNDAHGTEKSGEHKSEAAPNFLVRFGKGLVGLTLVSGGVLIRNVVDANVIAGISLAYAQGQSGVQPFLMGLLKRFPMAVGRVGIATGASALKYSFGVDIRTFDTVGQKKVRRRAKDMINFGRPDSLVKSLPMMLEGFRNAKGIDKAIAPFRGLLAPMVEELTANMPKRIHEYNILHEAGLGMPVTPMESERAFQGDLSSGGRGVSEFDSTTPLLQESMRSIRAAWGEIEALQALLGRTIFPRIGDIGGNLHLMAVGSTFVNELERKLKRAYLRRKDVGEDLSLDITEKELLGDFLGLMKANKASFNESMNFLSRGGVVNFQREAKEFFQRLDEAEDASAVRFLSDQQRVHVQEGVVTLHNAATPSNRPAVTKLSQLNSFIFTLMGWSINALQNVGRYSFLGTKSRQGTLSQKSVSLIGDFMYLLGFLMATVPSALIAMFLIGMFNYLFFGREPSKGYPWDKASTEDKIKSFIALSVSSIPQLGPWIESMLNEGRMRAAMHPGSWVMSKGEAVVEFGATIVQTGGPSYGGDRFVRQMFPTYKAVDQFTNPGRVALDDAVHGIRSFFPPDEVKHFRGQTLEARISSGADPEYKRARDWQYAVSLGDMDTAERIYNELIQKYASEDYPDIQGAEEARRAVNTYIKRMSPLRWGLESRLTEYEFNRRATNWRENRWTLVEDWYKRSMKVINNFDIFYRTVAQIESGVWAEEPASPKPTYKIKKAGTGRSSQRSRPLPGAIPMLPD